MRYLVSPSCEEAFELLTGQGNINKKMVVIVGRCKVDYSGRAKSFLDYGDRLVIVKPDGTVIVHNNEKREPLNWQPPGTKVNYEYKDGLFIEARRTGPVERMEIHFSHLHAVNIFTLDDGAALNLIGEESDIVDKIEKDPSVIEPGLRIIKREKMTDSGYIDLFCEDVDGNTVIVEVKRTNITISAINQLEAYIIDMRKKNQDLKVRGILCAPRISEMAKTLMEDKGLEYRKVEWEFELKDKKQSSLDFF